MTIEIDDESPVSPANKQKSPFVITPFAAWILVFSVIAMLVGLFAADLPVVPSREKMPQQERLMHDRPRQSGPKKESLIPILSPHLGSGQH